MRFEEQIMSKDKHPRIFSRKMEAIAFSSILEIASLTLRTGASTGTRFDFTRRSNRNSNRANKRETKF